MGEVFEKERKALKIVGDVIMFEQALITKKASRKIFQSRFDELENELRALGYGKK